MKKMSFKWLVVLCMAMGFATVAKAQIYSSEDCFYSKEGSSSVEYVVKFENMLKTGRGLKMYHIRR